MDKNEDSISSHFFKVLIPGFHERLDLPQSFCTKLKQEKSEWAMLKSRKGTSKIKVSRNSEGLISLEDGWPQFVDQQSLSFGDFFVLDHIGGLKFNVFAFDQSACEKQFLVEPKRENENEDDYEAETVVSNDIRNPYFVKTMTAYHEKYADVDVTIPTEFERLNNLEEKTSATLRDGRGRLWPITLKCRKFRMTMTKGWRDFYVSNDLKVGDVCYFYLNPGSPTSNTILFDVIIHPSV